MSVRLSLCALAATLTLAWLLATPNSAPSQPQPAESTEQRLQRLEEKIDKLLTVITEIRGDKRPATPPDAGGAAALASLRKKFEQKLETARMEYEQFFSASPLGAPLRAPAPSSILFARLAKIETRRSEIRTQLAVLQGTYNLVKKTAEKVGPGAARPILAVLDETKFEVSGAGANDRQVTALLSVLRQKVQTLGPNHPDVKVLGDQLELLKKLYAKGTEAAGPALSDNFKLVVAAMEGELEGTKLLLQALDTQFESEQKEANKMAEAEREQQRHRNNVEAARNALEMVNQFIKEFERPRGPSK